MKTIHCRILRNYFIPGERFKRRADPRINPHEVIYGLFGTVSICLKRSGTSFAVF
jgi:hypothetical protein